MQKPTSDAHSNTYSINANFEGISYTAHNGHISSAVSHPRHRQIPTAVVSAFHRIKDDIGIVQRHLEKNSQGCRIHTL